MIPAIIIIVILVIVIVAAIGCYNSLIRQRTTVEEAFSNMDVFLKKRFDLIPNLVETVKGYAKHEEETLTKLVNLRSVEYGNMSDEQKLENSKAVSQAIPKILAIAENYPDLKANQNFLNLSDQLNRVEEDIANSRRYYNGAVKKYNISLQTVPSNIVAGLFHFEKKPLYEIDNPEERQNVKVGF
jgi:LemA protein